MISREIDRPYMGAVRVDNSPFTRALIDMQPLSICRAIVIGQT